MKPLHGDTASNDSCFCTSCDSKSESDCESLKQLLAQSSRINRLFYGRYIPLRESKLLEKLVKTRALYDALRSQLLSSSLSVSSKANLKPGTSSTENRKALEEAKTSSDIFTLVDLVDKGAVLGSRKLSECCSCCTCNSKTRHHENVPKGRRNRQTHVGGNITSRSSVISKQRNSEESRPENKIRAKNIKSDPCSCACKLRGLIKLQSRVILKKIRPEQPIIERDYILKGTDKHKLMSLNNEKVRKSYNKLKKSKAQYIENMGEGGRRTIGKLKQPLIDKPDVKENNYIELLNIAEQKVKDSFIADGKALLKFKPEEGSRVRHNAEDYIFRTKKESVIKGKDKIGDKIQLQDQGLKQRLGRSLGRNKPAEKDSKDNVNSSTSNVDLHKKLHGTPDKPVKKLQRSPSQQRNIKNAVVAPQINNKEIPKKVNKSRDVADSNEKQSSKESGYPFVSKEKKGSVKSMTNLPPNTSEYKLQKTDKQLPFIETKGKKPSKFKPLRTPGKLLKTISTSSIENTTPVDTQDSNAFMTSKTSINLFNKDSKKKLQSIPKNNRTEPNKPLESPERHPIPKGLLLHKKTRQHKKPGIYEASGHREPPYKKQKHVIKSIQAGGHALKRCFNSLKIKPKKTKSRINKKASKELSRIREREDKDKKTSGKKNYIESESTTRYDPTHKPGHISKCECSNFIINTEKQGKFAISHATECECSESNIESKKKRANKQKSSQTNTQSESKSTSIDSSKSDRLDSNVSAKEKPAIMHPIGSKKMEPEKNTTSKFLATCECPVIKKLKSTALASECECSESNISSKEKISKHKPTSSSASNTNRVKKINKNRSVQTHNRIIICTKKQGIDIFSCRESIVNKNQTFIFEYPTNNIARKEIYVLPPKQRDKIATSKPRFSVEIVRKVYSKDGSQKSLDAHSKIKQGSVNLVYKRGINIKHIRNKKSQISNSRKNKQSQESHSSGKNKQSQISISTGKNKQSQISISTGKNKQSKISISTGKNKQSQISATTVKSKYTTKKHGLRSCLCTLKLGKHEKNKKNHSKPLKRKGSQTQFKVNNVSISTGRSEMSHSQTERIILPYECYPGVCIPGECNPQECSILLTKREEKKLKKHIKGSLKSQKTRSHLSLISRSAQLPRASKIQPTLISYKSEIPVQIFNKNNLPVDLTQQVRSSFASKFLKGKRSSTLYPRIYNGIQIKKESKSSALRNLKLDRDKEGVLQQDRSSLFGPAMKQCICTFKLHKKDKPNKRISADTSNMIVEEMYLQKATKKKSNQLGPIEYKPSTSGPGEYTHLESLKKKKNYVRPSKGFGIVTQKTKMISKSSDTRKLDSNKNLLFEKSNYKQGISSLRMFKNMGKISVLGQTPERTNEMYSEESIKQAVRFGSNFSFNIEFFKDVITDKKDLNGHCENKQKVKDLTNRLCNIRNSRPKTTRVSPLQKKCFCTLNLLKNDARSRDSKLLTPFVIKKPTQVYAVSTITIAKTGMNSEILLLKEVNLGSHCADSYIPTNSYSDAELRKTKQWPCFKHKSPPSVFSLSTIAFKSKKMHSYVRQSKCKLLQMSPMNRNLLGITSKETVRFKSKFSCEINYLNNIHSNRQSTLNNAHSRINLFPIRQRQQQNLEAQEKESAPNIIKGLNNPSQLTGIQPLLRKCYCTMNIQVAGEQSPGKRHYRPTKLKDYECEPGVCIPYECDPYECQKMIMKRLMKKTSRMSGAERRLRSSSSLTSGASSKTRKLQSRLPREPRHHAAKARHAGLKYQTLPRPPRAKRQAVRVGSTFSFDIEFSKGSSKSAPAAKTIKVPKHHSTNRSSRTYDKGRMNRGTFYGEGRRHKESQSLVKQMRHRASSVTPMLKRCFCTLKLQKKGRLHREWESQGISQGTLTPPKFQVEKPILRTTETGQNTRAKIKYPELLPYECEPNVCVPGECDPYACLELIKRRRKHTKDFGTESMVSRVTSSASITTRPKRTKARRIQSRNIRTRPIRSRDTAVRSKPSVMSIQKPVTPLRQAVRIGSSFNFNIEFFKEKSPLDVIGRQSPEIYIHKAPKPTRKVPKNVYAHRNRRDRFSQDEKSMRDSDSQIGIPKTGRSTMTGAFLKRCFCTAKLHGIKVDAGTRADSHIGGSISALKRCLCTLKSLTARRKDNTKISNVGHERAPPRYEKRGIKTQTRGRSPVLEPYECEPGVCVPGFCDPYECEKLIRKRRLKEKMAGTTGPRTKSMSSSFTSSKTSKAAMTQPIQARHDERVRKRHRSPREMVIREKSKSPALSHRQAVRIGSSFSFNIEFYKDKFPNYHQVQAAATTVKKMRPMRSHGRGSQYRSKTRDKALRRTGASLYSRESQMDAAEKKDKALGTMLKRCFCTLQLHKQSQANKRARHERLLRQQGTITPVIKEVPTLQSRSIMTVRRPNPLPYKLEPYECEPGVCVPGECNPYECEKRIKRRLMNRASGTLTDRYHTASTSFTTRPHRRRHRDSEAQYTMKHPKYTKERKPEFRRAVVERPSKQAVRIGSKFSFDIEFSKDKSPEGSMRRIKQYDSYDKPRRTSSRSTEGQSVYYRHRRAQRSRPVRDMDSQVLARRMRSTMTGVAPFLKRCFCTLQLHKSENKKIPFDVTPKVTSVAKKTETLKTQPKTEVSKAIKSKPQKSKPKTKREAGILEKSTYTRNQTQYRGRTLEPYECEPGVCVPGECDPYECEKRIRRRMQSKNFSTEPHKVRSISSYIAEPTKSKSRRNQARSYTRHRRAETADRPQEEEYIVYDTGPNRQAVRIRSSFSFNVEFYKNKSPQFPSVREVTNIISRENKGAEAGLKRSRSMASYGQRPRLRNCQSQSDCIKTECKSSCAPLLQRCFCTLKLQKKGRQQQYTNLKIEPTMKSMGTYTSRKNKVGINPTAREIGTKTKKYDRALGPYECEPGVCIPGQCDPYECEKRIQRRYMKHFGTETTSPSVMSMTTLISRDRGTKGMNTQPRRNRYDNRKLSTETIYRNKRTRHPSRALENTNRQAVRFGSNFSFNFEFFNERSSGRDSSYDNEIQTNYKSPTVRSRKSKASVSTANQIKYRNQGLHSRDMSLKHRQSQIGAEIQSRGSGMGPLLKRCFCTLTLQRAEVKSTLNSPVAQSTLNSPVVQNKTKERKKVTTNDKKTSTKKKNSQLPTPVHQLEPYECEPNVCVPGKCNPYECLERIKRRGIRRMSRTTGTRMKRSEQVSVASMAAQLIPGYTSKRTQLKSSFQPQKIDRIVEEPRFPLLTGHSNIQGVRISSNFSFNIEFFKDLSPPVTHLGDEDAKTTKTCPQKQICQTKDICVECSRKGKFKSQILQHRPQSYKHSEAQSKLVNTENKSSAVAMLRRCFCTAKLHKSQLGRLQHPQSVTVGRVEEKRPLSFFGQKEYWVQYQIQQPICKPCNRILPNYKKNNYSTSYPYKLDTRRSYTPSDPYKLETMSYTPSKFNKNNDPNSSIKKPSNTFYSTCQCNRKFFQGDSEEKHSSLKKIFCRCKHLFSKQQHPKSYDEVEKATEIPRIEVLKLSKSERHPKSTTTAGIKKSKSLKVAKVSEKDNTKKNFSRFQSGDADQGFNDTDKQQKESINFVTKICAHCQAQFQQAIPKRKQVRFAFMHNDKATRNEPAEVMVTEQKKESIPVQVLYKGPEFKVECPKLCSCCGAKIDSKPIISNYTKPTLSKEKLPCQCCVCTKKKYIKTRSGARFIKMPKRRPCVCGSVACKTEAEKLAENLHLELRRSKRKTCVCGTRICAAESLKEAHAKESAYIRARKKKKREKRLEKELKIREKQYKAEDLELAKKRQLEEKYMMKKVMQYRDTPDALLIAESVLDVSKLGLTSAGDIVRNLGRAVFDPRRTYKNMRLLFQDPRRAWKKFVDSANEGPGIATLKRLKYRCLALSCVKQGQEKLEEHPVTNFMIHSTDKDPKKRLRPRPRPLRRQRRPDPSFGCSPLMLSLRKRPWLSIYYKCAWFYPHCLSLLQVWRQFMDITLFLLAVAVWSPCILAMELCRAIMCCFFCTG